MSKISDLKKKFPELNISFFDIIEMLDNTKSNKYLPLLCKIFSERWDLTEKYGDEESYALKDIRNRIIDYGFNLPNTSKSELMVFSHLIEFYSPDFFKLLNDFIYYNEKNQIKNNDVLSYKSLDEIRDAVNLADLQTMDKVYEKQIIKEYEDDCWLAVRPLSFQSSLKYGSNTKWCTTMRNEKSYFTKYWKRGALIYFMNKKTGYKFASYKSITADKELSFWNSSDSRVDFLELEIDDYMYPIIKNIFKTEKTNRELCSIELQVAVELECDSYPLLNSAIGRDADTIANYEYLHDTEIPVTHPRFTAPTIA